jgi:calmodulin
MGWGPAPTPPPARPPPPRRLFDKDSDGCITTQELGTVMRALGKNPTEAQVKEIVKSIDPEGKGLVDFQEFLSVMQQDIKGYDSEADLRNAWKVFDAEGKGYITTQELQHVLTNIGEKLGPEEIANLIAEADSDNDGKVQQEEFVRLLTAK